jgi:2-keto-4-pentenoate hydratase
MASEAAEAIIDARRARRILAPLGAIAPKSVEAGYAVQKEVALRMGGLPPAGFKIGATTKQMQAYLGLSGPAGGFVPKAGLRMSPATVRFADFLNPGLECEVGLRLGARHARRPLHAGGGAATRWGRSSRRSRSSRSGMTTWRSSPRRR